jgi:hypothetical protein
MDVCTIFLEDWCVLCNPLVRPGHPAASRISSPANCIPLSDWRRLLLPLEPMNRFGRAVENRGTSFPVRAIVRSGVSIEPSDPAPVPQGLATDRWATAHDTRSDCARSSGKNIFASQSRGQQPQRRTAYATVSSTQIGPATTTATSGGMPPLPRQGEPVCAARCAACSAFPCAIMDIELAVDASPAFG